VGKTLRVLTFLGVLVGLLPVRGFSQQEPALAETRALAGIQAALRPVFPLTEISACERAGRYELGLATVEVGEAIELHNTAASKAVWRMSLPYAPGMGCGVYAGDLDNDGTQDLAILLFGGDSSGGYDTRLVVLLMDRDGRPFPWVTQGLFHAEAQGIQEVGIGRDGRATILDAIAVGHVAWGGVSHGYRLFRPAEGRVAEVVGEYGGVRWPVLPESNPDNEALRGKIAGSSRSEDVGGVASVRVVGVNRDGLRLADGRRVGLPELAVLDRVDGSRVVLIDPEQRELAAIATDGYAVSLVGSTDRYGAGGTFLLWARAVGR